MINTNSAEILSMVIKLDTYAIHVTDVDVVVVIFEILFMYRLYICSASVVLRATGGSGKHKDR